MTKKEYWKDAKVKAYQKKYQKQYRIKNPDNRWKDPKRKKYMKKYLSNYRIKNKERITKSQKNWYEKDKDYVKLKVKNWKLSNPERAKEIKQKWDEANHEHLKELQNIWRQNNPRSSRYYSIELQIAMNNRRKQDKNTCQWQGCGLTHKETIIHVHHIFPRNEYPELELIEQYMICYCEWHHGLWHKYRKDPCANLILSKLSN